MLSAAGNFEPVLDQAVLGQNELERIYSKEWWDYSSNTQSKHSEIPGKKQIDDEACIKEGTEQCN